MARKRKQAALTQRRLYATHKGAAKQPGGLTRLWSFVAEAAADGPEQSLATIELEVCCCDQIQRSSMFHDTCPAYMAAFKHLTVACSVPAGCREHQAPCLGDIGGSAHQRMPLHAVSCWRSRQTLQGGPCRLQKLVDCAQGDWHGTCVVGGHVDAAMSRSAVGVMEAVPEAWVQQELVPGFF